MTTASLMACARCGTTVAGPRATQKYCSERCRKRAEESRRLARRRGEPVKPGEPLERGATAGRRGARIVPLPPRECATCSAAFIPGNTLGVYCSRRCRHLARDLAHGLTCACCDSPMVRGHTSLPQGEAMCTACRVLAQPETIRARRLRGRQKRRAALADVESEPYTIQNITDRDGAECHLCGYAVNLDLRWPDRQCASIDHVVPVSKGGVDTLANVRLAHWHCNTVRGAGPIPLRDAMRARLLELAA